MLKHKLLGPTFGVSNSVGLGWGPQRTGAANNSQVVLVSLTRDHTLRTTALGELEWIWENELAVYITMCVRITCVGLVILEGLPKYPSTGSIVEVKGMHFEPVLLAIFILLVYWRTIWETLAWSTGSLPWPRITMPQRTLKSTDVLVPFSETLNWSMGHTH